MENIIKMVSEKSGISEAQSKIAVDTVVSFLKTKIPGGLGSQIESAISGGSGSAGDITGGIKDKIGGMFGN